ncbi:hypothetical protein F1880_000541 [Penicillium rolfsii]|nr:hypothetical protein F1880_000541 [Penicillium rolfsii]
MVSPSPQRSRRPVNHHLEESNSTASLFLGGVRRDWMASAGTSPREARPAAMSPLQPLNSHLVAAPSQDPQGIDPSGPTEPTLMSPVTPGASLQPSVPSHPHAARKPDPPTAALPSPVPSPGSHQSPSLSPRPTISLNGPPVAAVAVPPVSDKPPAVAAVTAQRRRDGNASPRQLASDQPSPSAQHSAPRHSLARLVEPSESLQSHTPSTADPSPRPQQVVANSILAQSRQTPNGPNQSPSLGPKAGSHTSDSHAIGSPLPRANPAPRRTSRDLSWPSSTDWTQWNLRANALLIEARACSPQLGGPRAVLLLNAFGDSDRDIFYLVLHQIFCEMSRDAHGLLAKLPVLRHNRCLMGLEKLAELLEDNSKLPPSLLAAFCVFPLRIDEYMNAPWYKLILERVVGCLSCLVTHLPRIKTETQHIIYERDYPPLVNELRQGFGVESPVLLRVIFMSICRHVYEPGKLDSLLHKFKENLFLVSHHAGPDALSALIEEYRLIPKKPRHLAPRPPVAVPQSQNPLPPQGAAPVGHSRSVVSSPVFNSPAPISPTLQANGQHHSACHWSHTQSTSMPNVPPYFRMDQYGRRISAQQAWQMKQRAQLQMAQAQGHAVQPVMLQPVDPGQGQGQNNQMEPVYMVTAGQSPQVLVPVTAVPPRLGASSSPSLNTVPGRPGHVIQQQQLLSPQQFQYQQQQQPQDPPTRSTSDSTTQFPSYMEGVSRMSHSRVRRPSSVRPVPVSPPVVQVPQTQVQNSRPGVAVALPLLPEAGYRAPQTVQPNPMRLGLHQADLREPVKQLVRQTSDGYEEIALYHYLGGFLLSPTRVDLEVFSYGWKFSISAEDYQRFPRYVDKGQGQRSIRIYQPGFRTHRLRAIALPNSHKEKLQSYWPTANTTWPSVLYIFVNKRELYVRRKVHNGKDLPLDITRHLREGENEVNVHFLLGPGECQEFQYAIAIETMEVSDYNEVLALTRHMIASETRDNIKKRLKSTTDDDELAVVSDSLTIPLIDPFMAQVFNTPARSTNCSHIDCFDLETFVTTRKSQSGPTPMIDNWRCPICKADARPQFLVVDHFFIDVREALKKDGCLETAQSIQVRADGTWDANVVTDDGSPSSPARRRLPQTSLSAKRKADSITGAAEQSSCAKHESPRNFPVQEPSIIEID